MSLLLLFGGAEAPAVPDPQPTSIAFGRDAYLTVGRDGTLTLSRKATLTLEEFPLKIPKYEVIVGESLPDLGMFVSTNQSLLTGLSTGHTFSLVVRNPGDTATLFTKSSGFTGQTGTGTAPTGTPNLVVQWATSGELGTLTAGRDHRAQLSVTRSSDSRVRKFPFILSAIDDPAL